LAVGPWWLLYHGPVGPTQQHAHHAFQIVFHLGPPLVEQEDGECAGPLVVIEPDVAHAFGRECDDVLSIYIEPESAAGVALRRRRLRIELPDDFNVELVGSGEPRTWLGAEQLVHRVLSATAADDVASGLRWWRNQAVSDALLRLPELVDEGAVDVSQLASAIGVSASRLTHVFTREVGIPLRSYARWLRLVTAVEYLADGATLTQAAHAARFSDAAHFSRVFKQMFGLPPSDVVGAADWIR
jgi:AraC-like DNA-binding protein